MTMSETAGRRGRKMQDKRDRIFRAAAELFAAEGFTAVTTQQISDRADVAAGTLFRYASSKSELLLMVYNDAFRSALEHGEAEAESSTTPSDAIWRLVRPTVDRARRDPVDSALYQRELLFGAPGERYRAEGLELVQRLETRIAQILVRAIASEHTADTEAIRVASASVFAATHLAIARVTTGAHADANALDDLHLQIEQIVAGVLALAAGSTQADRTRSTTHERTTHHE